MEDYSKDLVQQCWNVINWVTVFIVIQGLMFCYAIGQNNTFSENLGIPRIFWGTIFSMVFVQTACIIIVHICFSHICELHNIGKDPAALKKLLFQKWLRLFAIILYGIFPLSLLITDKIFKIAEKKNI